MGPTTGGRSPPSAHLPSQTNSYAEQVWRPEVSPDTQGQDHAGRRQFGFTFDPFTAPSSLATTGSARKPSLFHNHKSHSYAWTYHITAMRRLKYTCTGRRLSSMPLCHKNGNHALCYARLCQGLHSTAIKSDHLLGRSAPRTYSTICISSESCLGSLVGFARLSCFGTLCSVPSAKVALGELLRLCPGFAGRAPQ